MFPNSNEAARRRTAGRLKWLFRLSLYPDQLTFYARAYKRPFNWRGHSVRPGECGRYYL